MQSKTKSRLQIIGWFLVVAILALLFGRWAQHNLANAKKTDMLILQSGTLLPEPRPLQPFHLIATTDKTFTNSSLMNHWTFIFFGFTHCPQVCPTTLAVLNHIYKKLQQDQIGELPQVIFISVDPDRDSIPRIKKYLVSFNPAFIGARGDEEKITALTKQLNVVYAKVMADNESAENYSIDHSGAILLIDPAGKWHAIFSSPHDAEKIASDYEKIVNDAQQNNTALVKN